jgi:hypothetical protein
MRAERPSPGELRSVAVLARATAEDLARAVAVARTAGVIVDDEIYQCSAAVTSWAAWLDTYAQQADREDTT